MSDVPLTPKQLACLICGARFSKSAGLTWHRLARHKTIELQPGGGLSAVRAPVTAGKAGGSSAGAPTPPPTFPPPAAAAAAAAAVAGPKPPVAVAAAITAA